MKCEECQTKKAQRNCLKLNKSLCSLCCGGAKRDILCPPKCNHYKPPYQPSVLISSPTITNEETKERFPIPLDEYIPQASMLIRCKISNYSFNLVDSNTLKISFLCQLEEEYPNIIESLYLKEEWKKEQLLMALRIQDKDCAPVFVINKDANFIIYPEEIKIISTQGQEIESFIDSNRHLIVLPESIPRLAKPILDDDENYILYYGLNEVLYADLKQLIEPFRIELVIHNYSETFKEGKFNWQVPIMFPFGELSLAGLNEQAGAYTISEDSCVAALGPFIGKTIWGYEKAAAVFPVPSELQNIRLQYGLKASPVGFKDLKHNPHKTDKMCFLDFQLNYAPSRDSYVAVKLGRNPIPLALYEHLDNIQVLSIPLAVTFFTNAISDTVTLLVQSEIEGVTSVETQTVEVSGFQQISIKHKPKVIHGTSLPHETMETNFKVTIQKISISTTNLVYSQSFNIRLLAKDTMVWEAMLPNGISQRLGNYLACWVTPHNPEIDALISKAVNRMPNKMFFGYQGKTALHVQAQVKAIYEELSSMPLRYISRSISFGNNDYQSIQRVQWPSKTIVNHGNCIDLSLLMASLLESIGVNPVIVLVPGHAFLGWEVEEGGKDLDFLETTMIGYSTFEQALVAGRRKYSEEFNSKEYRQTQIVNIKKMRKQGVFPMTVF